MTPKRILVTGGAGFISSNFVRHLLGCTPYEVVLLDALTYAGNMDNLADLIGHELGMQVSYEWQRLGRGFTREYFVTQKCDVLIGIPIAFRELLTTQPYYRSSYMFVIRRDAPWKPLSLDDTRLHDALAFASIIRRAGLIRS